jgi:hypothetical protein
MRWRTCSSGFARYSQFDLARYASYLRAFSTIDEYVSLKDIADLATIKLSVATVTVVHRILNHICTSLTQSRLYIAYSTMDIDSEPENTSMDIDTLQSCKVEGNLPMDIDDDPNVVSFSYTFCRTSNLFEFVISGRRQKSHGCR